MQCMPSLRSNSRPLLNTDAKRPEAHPAKEHHPHGKDSHHPIHHSHHWYLLAGDRPAETLPQQLRTSSKAPSSFDTQVSHHATIFMFEVVTVVHVFSFEVVEAD